MKVERLRTLDRDMRRKGITKTQFKYRHNNLVFDVLFSIDGAYELLFGVVESKCSFIVKVEPGYNLIPAVRPSSAFYELCKLLNLTADPNNRFSANAFFADFATKVPEIADSKKNASLPSSLTPEVNEEDKTVFLGWRNNSEQSGNVTIPNLEKTLKAFGPEIRNFCASKNISSRWSPEKK